MPPLRHTLFRFALPCSSALSVALLAQSGALGGDSAPKNTVFRSDSGEAWTVSIKPAQRTAQAETRAVPVPDPVELVSAEAPQDAAPPPPAGIPGDFPSDLPPVPVMTTGQKGSAATQRHGVTVVPDSKQHLVVYGRRYEDAYRSIPFNRAEYDANPSYRHEAAMELLFGQMRPTTIVKQMPAPRVEEPAYSPYKPYLPAYGDYSSFRALNWPLPYPTMWGLPNTWMWPGF